MANLVQFQKVPVEIQKRNGFDESHRASGTATCGTLTPVLSKFLIPSTEFNLSAVMQVDFPPFATDFKGRINAAIESFWIPCRLAFAGWKKFIKLGINGNVFLPWIIHTEDSVSFLDASTFGHGTLADYLLISPAIRNGVLQLGPISSAIPFINYGLVYNYWYRNKNVQIPLFSDDADDNISWINLILSSFDPSSLYTYETSIGVVYNLDSPTEGLPVWNDDISIFSLRQRNYPKDYFTSAFPNSRVVASQQVKIGVTDDAFDIATLRGANSATLFLERYMMAGDDYDDIMYANYGIRPSDAAVNHPLYLGRIRSVVYNRFVDNTNGDSADAGSTRNPLAGVLGGAGARGNVADRGNLVRNFTTTEHGYLLCLFSIWPDAQYNEGVRRDALIADITHIPWPLLQSVGYDKIYKNEIYASPITQAGDGFDAFAYAERYAWYKFEKDHVNGLLRPGANLSSFAIQRVFNGVPTFGSSFLQVGKNDLDNVFAVTQASSGFSCWYDIYFTFHVSAPLAAYCIPTLGEPKDARTVWIENGGHML